MPGTTRLALPLFFLALTVPAGAAAASTPRSTATKSNWTPRACPPR